MGIFGTLTILTIPVAIHLLLLTIKPDEYEYKPYLQGKDLFFIFDTLNHDNLKYYLRYSFICAVILTPIVTISWLINLGFYRYTFSILLLIAVYRIFTYSFFHDFFQGVLDYLSLNWKPILIIFIVLIISSIILFPCQAVFVFIGLATLTAIIGAVTGPGLAYTEADIAVFSLWMLVAGIFVGIAVLLDWLLCQQIFFG